MHRDRQHVVGDVPVVVLVEVVPDPGPVREQVLNGDGVLDQRQVRAEQAPSGRAPLEQPLLDQAHHGQGGHALHRAGDGELGLWRVEDSVRAVGQPEGLHQLGPATAVHAYGPGELVLRRDPGQYFWFHKRWKTRPPEEPLRDEPGTTFPTERTEE